MSHMTQIDKKSVTLYAEQEHSGIRAVVVLSMVISYLFCFSFINILSQLLPERIASLGFIVACLFSFPLAIGITWLLERWLKGKWHSGYNLTIEDGNIHVSQRKMDDMEFDLDNNYSNLNWYFKLSGYKRGGRERRLPDKWICLASQIQQDEYRLVVYAFAPPKKTAVYQDDHPLQFEKLSPSDIYESHGTDRFAPPTRPNKLPTTVISGKNGRYWLAEQRRWQEGLELTFDDFEIFLTHLQNHSF